MTDLFLHNKKVNSVFQLLGEDENDISFSVAWALANCPSFLDTFVKDQIQPKSEYAEVLIRLQHLSGKGQEDGYTDIEIESPGFFCVIIETKKGWQLPTLGQLSKYANRLKTSQIPLRLIFTVSECSKEYATTNLNISNVLGIPIKHVSWKTIAKLAKKSYRTESHSGKHLIDELLVYLEEHIKMQNIYSNEVYVVAISERNNPKWGISWIDIIKKYQSYFHPVGGGPGGWPKEPPNYIAFRYYGKLQSIHHIENYEIFTNPNEKFPEIPEKQWKPHYLYKLGPAIYPSRNVRSTNIRARRVWCMLDTLLVVDTIPEAETLTKTRKKTVSAT